MASHQIRGTVRTAQGTPGAGARVRVRGTQIHAVADSTGRFFIEQYVPDSASIEVYLLGQPSVVRLRVGDLPHDPRRPAHAIADVAFVRRLAPGRPLDLAGDTVLDAYAARVASAAGLRRLRDVARRPGDPEVRLYMGGGLFQPEDLLVLRRHDGRVDGALWLWWRSLRHATRPDFGQEEAWRAEVAESESLATAYAANFGCPQSRWQRQRHVANSADDSGEGRPLLLCRATFVREPGWQALWNRLDSLGVWTLPDASELPRDADLVTTDGVGLSVEAFDGRRYRAYSHSNPDSTISPEAGRAAAMIRLVIDLTRDVRYRRDEEPR